MYAVQIETVNNQTVFELGDIVKGTIQLLVDEQIPLHNVVASFECVAEEKWSKYQLSPYFPTGNEYSDRHCFHRESLVLDNANIIVDYQGSNKDLSIPFEFHIPLDKSLPSSMASEHGYIGYFIEVSIQMPNKPQEVKTFSKEISILAPIKDKLKVSVGGSAEKYVLMYDGKVSMHASIDQKGCARGQSVAVNILVDNESNANVTPRASLHQLQIYTSEFGHKTIDTQVTEAVLGEKVHFNSAKEQVIQIVIPTNEALSIKSSLITVKYFVHITLDIPQSFDLHINLPLIVTTLSALQ